jgi:hypothetical protein
MQGLGWPQKQEILNYPSHIFKSERGYVDNIVRISRAYVAIINVSKNDLILIKFRKNITNLIHISLLKNSPTLNKENLSNDIQFGNNFLTKMFGGASFLDGRSRNSQPHVDRIW